MECLFNDSVGPLTHTKYGNLMILVIVDRFSKFVFFRPVCKILSQVVSNCLERVFSPACGMPISIGMDNATSLLL
jgi:hypothetical protein